MAAQPVSSRSSVNFFFFFCEFLILRVFSIFPKGSQRNFLFLDRSVPLDSFGWVGVFQNSNLPTSQTSATTEFPLVFQFPVIKPREKKVMPRLAKGRRRQLPKPQRSSCGWQGLCNPRRRQASLSKGPNFKEKLLSKSVIWKWFDE